MQSVAGQLSDGPVIVASPLIARQRDQVEEVEAVVPTEDGAGPELDH